MPSHSAVKRDGRPLYESARRGEVLDLPQRDVVIHALDLLAFDPPHLTLHVACSSGTYIRSLAHDLGAALGCGGHVAALTLVVRKPIEMCIRDRLSLGQRLPAPPDAPPRHAAAFGPDGRFLGVVEVDGDVIRPRKMLAGTDL